MASENRLLQIVAGTDRRRLLALCEPVELVLGRELCAPSTPARHVYFPIDGFISLVATVADSPGLEVGMVGREGLVGSQLALGIGTSSVQGIVQGAGTAMRIGSVRFRGELARSASLRKVLNRYIGVLMVQSATSAVCLRFHHIAPRLARWLLMSHDRAGNDTFPITHHRLAGMLGVRRVGVTAGATALQRAGLIQYRRGVLTVVDRAGLEAVACPCYAADHRAYSDGLT